MVARVTARLRAFPGFDDFTLTIDSLHVRRRRDGTFYVGRYAAGGTGLNFGFFFLAQFAAAEPNRMIADVSRGIAYAADDQREPVISRELLAAMKSLRYDWFVRGSELLIDFDTRIIRHDDFAPTLRFATEHVPRFAPWFSSA